MDKHVTEAVYLTLPYLGSGMVSLPLENSVTTNG